MLRERFADKDFLARFKICVELLAIVFAGLFAAWTWGVESMWDREEHYATSLSEMQSSPKRYLRETATMIGGHEYCLLEGTLEVNNYSSAPIHIENSTLRFVPFESDRFLDLSGRESEGCLISNTISNVADRVC